MDGENLWDKRLRSAESITPDFDENAGALPQEYWDDWLKNLIEENRLRLNMAEEDIMSYLSLEVVEYIFTVCVRMRLPGEIRYLAALYFDRFMRKQTRSLFEYIAKSNMSLLRKDDEWGKVEANLSRQIPLRVCSCIQLASKDFQYHTSLSSKEVVSMLRSLGNAYTMKAVYKSELRVVKTLNFRLPSNPTQYPETMLKYIASNSKEQLGISENINFKVCWDIILILLDLFFLYHNQFAETLLTNNNPDIPHSPLTHARIKSDYVVLGAGLVCAAVYAHHGEEISVKLTEPLSKWIKISDDQILDTCCSIISLFQDNK